MKLNEVFDKEYEWEEVSPNKYVFEIENGSLYTVEFSQYDEYQVERYDYEPFEIYSMLGQNQYNMWEASFTQRASRDTPEKEKTYKVIGGVARPSQVLGTVLKIMEHAIKKNNIRMMFFTAKEKSRIKLYARMIKTIGNKFFKKIVFGEMCEHYEDDGPTHCDKGWFLQR